MDPTSVQVAATPIDQSGRPVVQPGAFLCDGNVALRVNSWNSLAGVTVTVRMRFLGLDGREVDNTFDVVPNTNRTKATNDFPLGLGFPLNIIAFASVGAPTIGQTFIQVQLIRGLGGATLPMATLLQDYLTASQTLTFPGSPIRTSIEGNGAVRLITGTTPGAGAEISETVPSGARWMILALRAVLTTSVAVANRIPRLTLDDGVTGYWDHSANFSQTASAVWLNDWSQGLFQASAAAASQVPQSLPTNVVLAGGHRIRTFTTALQAADQWSSVAYLVREWIDI